MLPVVSTRPTSIDLLFRPASALHHSYMNNLAQSVSSELLEVRDMIRRALKLGLS